LPAGSPYQIERLSSTPSLSRQLASLISHGVQDALELILSTSSGYLATDIITERTKRVELNEGCGEASY
jgi:hypothetical protein